ncbi:MAG: UDP-N-acetylmuramate dehydrogenase [Calditrichaeota bacterium]|nr:UDP-N-acetylmuramate dehydrogenase [Calditrichota bacterium]MCB9368511.1 UDP-N-acetylmuramate dehydrogenase [Calditrichota bacterium]
MSTEFDQKLERLKSVATCSVREDVLLAPLTTFRVGGKADILAEPKNEIELLELVNHLNEIGIPYFYLGLGSNLLVSDAGIRGVVIRSRGDLASMSIDDTIVTAGPAARLLLLTTFAARHSLSGLEQLSGIPGTVGGGLFMNAGAYGGEISDTLIDVRVMTPSLEIKTFSKNDISFGYRSAPELRDVIVLASRYQLKRAEQSDIFSEMRRVWRLRREKQPIEFPSAGSIFKRPPGDFAGRLIEAAGCKGLRIGGATVPTTHAGIFINDRAGTATEIAELIRTVRTRVRDQFSVILENEILPVGFDADPFELKT